MGLRQQSEIGVDQDKMKKYHYWRGFTLALLVLVYVNLFFLSKEVIYKGYLPTDEYNATLEIDVCFRSFISESYCHNLPAPDEYSPKKEFVCRFEDRIGCYTKGFDQKNVSEIIRKFQSCNLPDLVEVKSETKNVTKISEEMLLFGKFVCAKYTFQIHEKEERSLFSILTNSTYKNQPFKVYITYGREYELDGKYKTKKTHLLDRACWIEQDKSLKCTETSKKVVIEVEYYSAKYLERPFDTDCVYRKDPKRFTQTDCYESCIKDQANHHLLTYKESENVQLVFNKTSELGKIIEGCAESCNQEDCNTMMIHIDDIYEEKREHSDGQIILSLDSSDYRREAIPLIGVAKLVWIVIAFASTFFGINFYGMLIKSENTYSLFNFTTARNKKRKIKRKKVLTMMIVVALLSLILALVFEKIFFDFGREHNVALLRKESIEERSVSVSICFDLCKIIKEEFKDKQPPGDCIEGELIEKWTIQELDEITWNTSDFKQRAWMKNNARIYPIRQDDFPIPRFFRDFKKCFLVYYEAKNYWPHMSMQRFSRIFINFEGNVPYRHFFVEDGHNYPKIESTPTRISVLHSVSLERHRRRDGCVDYLNSFAKTRDTLIRQCIIEESFERVKGIPIQVALQVDDYNSSETRFIKQYSDSRFYNDPDLFKNLSKICKEKYRENECNDVSTHLTHQDLSVLWGTSINLTPYIFEKKPFDDEGFLIVANRIFSLLIIFMGCSIKELSNAIFSTYFINFSSHSFRLTRRLFQLALSIFFLLHFCFLYYCIIYHPMLETSSNQHVTDIEPLAITRFCFRSPSINLESNVWKVKDLNLVTLDFSEVFEKIQIFDDDDKKTAELNIADFEFKNETNGLAHRPAWVSQKDDRIIKANSFYFHLLKCYTFYIRSLKNKTEKNLNVHYHRLQKLFTMSFSLKNLKKHRKSENHPASFYIYFDRAFSVDFDWPKQIGYGDFGLVFSTAKRRYLII